MEIKVWMFLLAMTLPDLAKTKLMNRYGTDDESLLAENGTKPAAVARQIESDECLLRLEKALTSMSSRQSLTNTAMIDLSGYALHQQLRTAPLDMYVTDMRIKVPTNNIEQWAKVDKCRFDASTRILQAKLMFQDLIVTASVKLFNDQLVGPSPTMPSVASDSAATVKCNMTLRLRQAGLGFVVAPEHIALSTVGIRTSATFVDPNFVSIHAYNCQPINSAGRGEYQQRRSAATSVTGGNEEVSAGLAEPRIPSPASGDGEEVNQEMEDVFLRGIRSLLTKYMEKQLQPALKDALMINLGYTISYGKRR